MELPDELKSKSVEALEDWFLAAVESRDTKTETALTVLDAVEEAGAGARTGEMAQMLQDSLANQGRAEDVLAVLRWRARGRNGDRAFAEACARTLKTQFGDRLRIAFVESVFVDAAVPASEALRRLGVLLTLRPGAYCLDKTWGFGQVKAVEEFYRRVSVDFDRKRGHSMSFAYAGESLVLLADDHLYVRRAKAPEEIAAMARNDPAGLVRLVLSSFGGTDAVRLQEILSPAIVPAADWKAFWDTARKGLKADPRVEMPSRRSEPIRLLKQDKSYGADWFDALEKQNDPEKVLRALTTLKAAMPPSRLDPAGRGAVARRLQYVAWACDVKQVDLTLQALLAAEEWGCGPAEGGPDPAAWQERFLDEASFLLSAQQVGAREAVALLRMMSARDAGRAHELWLRSLHRLPITVLDEAIARLMGSEREADLLGLLRTIFRSRQANVEILLWACRHLDTVRGLGLTPTGELLGQVAESLALDLSGERLRAQNQLRKLMEKAEWLAVALDDMSEREKESLMTRVQSVTGMDALAKRAVLAGLVAADPETKRILEAGIREPEEEESAVRRYASWRTFRERQAQLKRLIEEEIPANSREIARARSYGDLRENAEYKFAKEHQGILHRRRDEIERDLRVVHGTDFEGFATDVAGVGVAVRLRRADGTVARHCILGEWDRDEPLGILPNGSGVAVRLTGRRAGETVQLPTDGGEETWTIEAVEPLPPEVKRWVRGADAVPVAPAVAAANPPPTVSEAAERAVAAEPSA